MRTAYKAWSGVFVSTFVLVAVAQGCGNQEANRAQTAADQARYTAPPFAPAGTVAAVSGWADVTLTDGRLIHIPMLNGIVNATDDCDRDASMALATDLLAGKPVQLAAPPRTSDADGVAPRGWTQADVTVSGVDYAEAFKAQQARYWYQRCAPPPEPVPTTEPAPASSSGDDVDVDVHHDGHTNHRDGAFTGGFCRRHWWC